MGTTSRIAKPGPRSVLEKGIWGSTMTGALSSIGDRRTGNDIAHAASRVLMAALLLQNIAKANAGSDTSDSDSANFMQPTFWLRLPEIPYLISEWAALIPLAVYLSSARSDYELAGEVALRGRLSVSVIPKVWALGGIAKMLRQAEVFFDTAGAVGDPVKVYDVQWGSTFPCYNSAATLAVEENALDRRRTRPDISQGDLNHWILQNRSELLRRFTFYSVPKENKGRISDVFCGGDVEGLVKRKQRYGRRQLLKVIVIRPSAVRPGGRQRLRKLVQTSYWKVGELIATLLLAGFLLSCGFIGSGSLLIIGAMSRFCLHTVKFDRSPLYLRNREVHDGCMLTSLHENATAWTLYIGHRGLIDSLLNKPMVEPGKAHPLILFYFQFAEVLQVIAMTYVASQKGWDGVVFMILMVITWTFTSISGNNKHAARWLEEEGFVLTGFSCEFPGRTELLGAVQLLSTEKKVYWMDGILAPVPRREVWLKKIGAIDSDMAQTESDWASLNDHDRSWVNATGMQSIAGYRVIQERLKEMVGSHQLESLAHREG